MKRAGNNEAILRRIRALKAEHPFWGYRRVWAYLRYREGLPINKKRIYRLMKEHNMLVRSNERLKACRTPSRPKPRASRPNELWGIDMTKVMVPTWGWLYLHVILDWYSKKIVGYNLSCRSKAQDWREALEGALNRQFSPGDSRRRAAAPCQRSRQPAHLDELHQGMRPSGNHADLYELQQSQRKCRYRAGPANHQRRPRLAQ
jgi:transposase InsO family protein